MIVSRTADRHPLASANDRVRPRIECAVQPATATATALPGGTPPVWTVEPITDYQTFLDLEPLWNKLVDEANTDHPFVRHEWVRTWWECFGAGQELYILLVKTNREPLPSSP
jgi:hypothetical protein